MRKRVRLMASKPFNNMNLTHSLTPSRTCDASAGVEVHTLQAHGKMQLRKVTCEKEHR